MIEETARRLRNVLAACQAIERFTGGASFEAYLASLYMRSAVERQFEIVGEALNRAAQADEALQDKIPELRQVVGLRNRLIHGYDSVDDEIVWDAIQTKLPVLNERVSALLVEAGEPLS